MRKRKRPTICSRPSKKGCTELTQSSTYAGDLQLNDRIYRQLRCGTCPSPTTAEEAHEALKAQAEEDNKNMLRLVCGAIGPLYVQQAKQQGAIVIEDDGTHVCGPGCYIVPLNVRLFSACNAKHPGGVHVCLGTSCRNAPAKVHTFPISPIYNSAFFVCKDSGRVHLCTETMCECVKISSVDGETCPLSGKVYPAKNACIQLSHGWKEDEWKGQSHVPAESAARKSKVVPLDESKQVRKHIRQLFPGHLNRKAADAKFRTRVTLALYVCWDKLARCAKHKCVTRPWLYLDMRAAAVQAQHELSKSKTTTLLDVDQLDRISETYAQVTCEYYQQLITHTDIVADEPLKLTNFVVSCLYLMRSHFTVDQTTIFCADPFLVSFLPPANSLEHYENINRTNFTDTKTRIQKAVYQAIRHNGKSPELLCPPIIAISDLV